MRVVGSNGEATDQAIRKYAVEVFAKHGFKAASMRMIAKGVNIKAPSLYNYYPSKERLLFELMREPLTELNAAYVEKSSGVDDPLQRLLVFMGVHLGYHIDFRLEVFIGNMELRNLDEEHYKIISKLRDDYSLKLSSIIEDGAKAGVFHAEDVRITTFAVLSLLSGVCNWYRPGGPLSREQVIDIHTRLALRTLGVDEAVLDAQQSKPQAGKAAGARQGATRAGAATAVKKAARKSKAASVAAKA